MFTAVIDWHQIQALDRKKSILGEPRLLFNYYECSYSWVGMHSEQEFVVYDRYRYVMQNSGNLLLPKARISYISPLRSQKWCSEEIWDRNSVTKQSPSGRSSWWPGPRHWAVQVSRPSASVLLAQAKTSPETGTGHSLQGGRPWTWLQ